MTFSNIIGLPLGLGIFIRRRCIGQNTTTSRWHLAYTQNTLKSISFFTVRTSTSKNTFSIPAWTCWKTSCCRTTYIRHKKTSLKLSLTLSWRAARTHRERPVECHCELQTSSILSRVATLETNAVWLVFFTAIHSPTRMWANAQRDGRPAEHRWRPLFNAPKFGWRPNAHTRCRAVTLPTRETRWNLQGALNYRIDLSCQWAKVRHIMRTCGGHIAALYVFPIVDMCLSREDIARQSCAMVPRWRFWRLFESCIFSEPRAARFRQAS